MIDAILNSAMFQKLLESLPLEERDRARAELAMQIEPLGRLLSVMPSEGHDIFNSLINPQKEEQQPATQSRRQPKRF